MKKCITALFALVATMGLAWSQESELKTNTAGLIEDGVIDNLDFGFDDDEEGSKGIVFAGTNASEVQAGFGQYFGDGLWLSFYDRYNYAAVGISETESITHTYGTTDGINVDYVDTARTLTVGSGSKALYNKFAVGIALNNGMGFQPYWTMNNWLTYKTPYQITAGSGLSTTTTTTETSSGSTATGTSTESEYTDIKHKTRDNIWGVNFNGIGTPKLLGERELYFALNEIRVKSNLEKGSGDYSNSTKVNGTTTTSTTADGTLKTGTITPGINLETGFFLAQFGVVKTNFELEEDFEMGFEVSESNTHHSVVTNTATKKTTVSTDYERNYGDYFSWSNTLTPKFIFDFDVDERLTLKAKASFAVGLSRTSNDGDTYETTKTTKTYDKSSSTTTVNTVHTKASAGDQNQVDFTATLSPKFDLGFVYQAVPDRLNLNFGISVLTGKFTWKKTDKTNTNENTVVKTTNKDELGNTTSTTTVTVNQGSAETSEYSFSNGYTNATVYLGATWFFSPNVKMDVYYANSGTALFSDTNTFGIDFSIKY